ncbi:MAG: T9SS type A sorting domain-containing protein [Balneolaceae bacterium]
MKTIITFLLTLVLLSVSYTIAQPVPVTVRDLNTYESLLSVQDIPNHELAGQTVSFTAVILSHPKNSGLAFYNQETGMIGRSHVFVIDTSANSMGRDGMYMQLVTSGETMLQLEELTRGDVIYIEGVHNFFNNEVQLNPNYIQNLGNVFTNFDIYAPLLEPTIVATEHLNEAVEGGEQINLANYSNLVNMYVQVQVQGAVVSKSQSNTAGVPWFYFRNGDVGVYQRATSLRYRNDWASYREGYNLRRDEDGVFTPPLPGSVISIRGFVTTYLTGEDPAGVKASSEAEVFAITPWDDGVLWQEIDGHMIRTEPEGWPVDLEITEEGSPDSTSEYLEVSIRELNTYDQINTVHDIPSHPLAGEQISFGAVVVSYPQNSGLAGYNPNQEISIARSHVFVVDTSANSLGKDGMYMQLVSTGDALLQMEELTRGDLIKVKGTHSFFGNEVQLNPQSIEHLGNVFENFQIFQNLLEPTVISAEILNTDMGSGAEINLDSYSDYINRYVRFENINIGGSVANDEGRPWLYVSNGNGKIYTKDTSLRFRNDRDEYRVGYNWRRGEEGPFTPPVQGERINLNGFVTLHPSDFDPAGIKSDSADQLYSIAPWDDGVVWVEQGGVPSRTEPDGWPIDIEILSEPEPTTITGEIGVENISGLVGDIQTLSIELVSTNGVPFESFQLEVHYDPALIAFNIPDQTGTLAENFTFEVNAPEAGVFLISAASTEFVSGLGELFLLEVELLANGSDTIEVSNAYLNESQISDSSILVNITGRLCGDVTNDGSITATDASYVLRHTVKLAPQYPLAGDDSTAADVTGNGWISAYDASQILKYDVGLPAIMECAPQAAKVQPLAANISWDFNRTNDEQTLFEIPVIATNVDGELNSVELTMPLSKGLEFKGFSGIPDNWQVTTNEVDDVVYISMFGAEAVSSEVLGTAEIKVTDQSQSQSVEAMVILNENESVSLERLTLNEIPKEFELSQNYPNPFNPVTQIKYSVPEETKVQLTIFNLLGQTVAELVNEQKSPGRYTVSWDAENNSSGVYMYRLVAGENILTNKMMLIK